MWRELHMRTVGSMWVQHERLVDKNLQHDIGYSRIILKTLSKLSSQIIIFFDLEVFFPNQNIF